VDAEKVEATYRDGVLLIELPKKEEAKTRKIDAVLEAGVLNLTLHRKEAIKPRKIAVRS
jgi:HSP20 family molecular chaperone IbpA